MCRKIEGFPSAIDVLYDLYEMPPHRASKAAALYYLARSATGGDIVELGTFIGTGAIALAIGAQDGNCAKVHTVDLFDGITGWAGEHYAAENYEVLLGKLARCEEITGRNLAISVHVMDVIQAAAEWSTPVSLLFWDTGTAQCAQHVEAWQRHIIVGGKIAMHDTSDQKLGSKIATSRLEKTGAFEKDVPWRGGVFTVRRVK